MSQIHKRFTSDEVKELLERYSTQSHSQLKFCMAPFKTEDHNITIKQQPLLFPG